ncbi:related to squalene monooxygenase [Cephalotrichum gorgonifer]|uniref:Squalene monooxygenase n=1 Tax=Cephalotrichum gorgonifer TaxID=2041049 RepID=A0AAE8N6W2_9PEZI|nr:related to squalene monooxygenase [Cephalotrichum gorgonifer]
MTETATLSVTTTEASRRENYHEADVVVVGAGVFGCAMAFALARQGRSVILLERWMHEPDRIVGELLQPGGVAALRKLGLEQALEGIDAIPCVGYNVIHQGTQVTIPYPYLDGTGRVICTNRGESAEGGARPQGRGFHHGRFIMQLRRACLAEPNVTVVETEATKPIRGDHSDQILGVEALTKDRETGEKRKDYFFGHLTVVADGYASKFRNEHLGAKPVVRSKFYALELIDCPLPMKGYGHVVIGDTFPVLLYQIGTHETRALVDVPENLPAASPAAGGVRGYITNVVVPSLPEQLRPCVLRALEDGRLPRSMPNSWLPPTKQAANGMVVLGDAMNMRHPLTGGGMTVALSDVVVLSDLLSPEAVPSLSDVAAVQSAMDRFYWRRKRYTSIINVLAQALYSLFAANDRQLRALRRGCFSYFTNGVTEEPAGMLGGVLQNPWVLTRHFFTVAFVAIWVNAVDLVTANPLLGIFMIPVAVVDAVLILWKASVVFLPVAWKELM